MTEPAVPPLERVLARDERGVRSIADGALGIDRDKPASAEQRAAQPAKEQLRRTVQNLPILVPPADWEKVVTGTKRMYRTYSHNWRDYHAPLVPPGTEVPRPVLLYVRPRRYLVTDTRLGVLTGYRQEPLGAISVKDLEAEGFRSIRHFKRYWKLRHSNRGYRPLDLISVVEVRPWEPEDADTFGRWALEALYGDLL